MKELSTEQKAKRYDEAIEIAREINNEQRAQPFNVMTRVFPELKESEGEKTRKEILDYIIKGSESCYDVQQYGKEKFEKWIAWLEKQGEQRHVPDWMPKFLDELRSKKNYFDWEEHKDIEGGILAIIKWMNPNYFNGKDGEQKPTDKVEQKFKVGDVVRSSNDTMLKIVGITDYCYNCVTCATNDEYSFGFNIQDEFELVEQKPSWSEEDENTIKVLMNIIKKSEMIDPLIYTDSLKEKLYDWLKHLRPHWKPSKEQIVALRWVLNNIPYNKHKEEISGLLDQIKEL